MNRRVTQSIAAQLLGVPAGTGRYIARGPQIVDLQATSIRDLLGLAKTADQVHEIVGRTLELRGVGLKTRRNWAHAADVRLGELRAEALSR